jgi:hypothetical protein
VSSKRRSFRNFSPDLSISFPWNTARRWTLTRGLWPKTVFVRRTFKLQARGPGHTFSWIVQDIRFSFQNVGGRFRIGRVIRPLNRSPLS